jgi:fatty acid desaturase
MAVYKGVDISIPQKTNALVLIIAPIISISFLYGASHSDSIWVIILCAIGFSLVNNTIFALLHEAVHFTLFENRRMNDIFGQIAAIFFPTGLIFQRVCHLNHHRSNRTDDEMFEAYYPNDNRFIKTIQWYGLLLGFYWPTVVIGWLMHLVVPKSALLATKNDTKNRVKHTGANAYALAIASSRNQVQMKIELLITLITHVAMFYLFDYAWAPVLFCYWVFSLNWGALQYADHAYTKRDIRYGAWNLSVPKIIRMIYLDYHHHLAHHTHPHVPWIHLKQFVDEQREQPSFIKIYLKIDE